MNENIIVAITKLNEIVTDIDKDDTCFLDIKDTVEEVIALLKAKDINVPTKWISVKDRLPDAAGYKCLVMAINKFGQKSVFTAHTGYGDFEWYTTDVIYMNKVNRNTVSDAWTITNWMPLPEPPKEDEA